MNMHKRIKQYVKGYFAHLAGFVDRVSRSRITPNAVTMTALVAHIPIALLLGKGYLFVGGLLVVFFGLFDTLDGALARVQKRESELGMFLDASTDRLKELLIYAGLITWFARTEHVWVVTLAVIACGVSLSVSYVKARGEVAIAAARTDLTHQQLNRIFDDGLGSYDVRIVVLAIGAIAGRPLYAVVLILLVALYTLLVRMVKISRTLTQHA